MWSLRCVLSRPGRPSLCPSAFHTLIWSKPVNFPAEDKVQEIKSNRCQSAGASQWPIKVLSSKAQSFVLSYYIVIKRDGSSLFEEESDLFVWKHAAGHSSLQEPWEQSNGWQAGAAGDGSDWHPSAIFVFFCSAELSAACLAPCSLCRQTFLWASLRRRPNSQRPAAKMLWWGFFCADDRQTVLVSSDYASVMKSVIRSKENCDSWQIPSINVDTV